MKNADERRVNSLVAVVVRLIRAFAVVALARRSGDALHAHVETEVVCLLGRHLRELDVLRGVRRITNVQTDQ